MTSIFPWGPYDCGKEEEPEDTGRGVTPGQTLVLRSPLGSRNERDTRQNQQATSHSDGRKLLVEQHHSKDRTKQRLDKQCDRGFRAVYPA
jgi:hypothetical protein